MNSTLYHVALKVTDNLANLASNMPNNSSDSSNDGNGYEDLTIISMRPRK